MAARLKCTACAGLASMGEPLPFGASIASYMKRLTAHLNKKAFKFMTNFLNPKEFAQKLRENGQKVDHITSWADAFSIQYSSEMQTAADFIGGRRADFMAFDANTLQKLVPSLAGHGVIVDID